MNRFITLLAVLFYVLLAGQLANAGTDLDNKCINAAGFESNGSGIAWSRINMDEAIEICTKATDQSDATGAAWAALGRVLYKKYGCTYGSYNCRRTEHVLSNAIELNSAEGYLAMGILYQDHIGSQGNNTVDPLQLYRKSIEIKPLGLAHQRIYEILIEREGDEWRDHLTKAVALKNEHAIDKLGRYHLKGQHGYPEDVNKGIALLKEAGELGSVRALNKLGNMYYYGNHVPESNEKAAEFFRQAVDQNSGYGAYSLGYMYGNGELGAVDRKKAQKYYLLGHKWGDCNDPLTALGDTYFEKKGTVKPDYANAVRWYQNAVDRGETASLMKLVHMHRNGLGVPQNEEKADKLAATYGLSLSNLVDLLEDREDLSDDIQDEIVLHLQRAADGGNANAYSMLVDAYSDGYGSLSSSAGRRLNAAKAYLLSLAVKSDDSTQTETQAGALKNPVPDNFDQLSWSHIRQLMRKMRRAGLFTAETTEKYGRSEVARYLDLKNNDEFREKRIEFIKGPGPNSWTHPGGDGFHPGQAYFDIASTHYNVGNKQKSALWMRRCASAGHPVCIANIASMHVYGDGLDKDLNRAREWIDKNSNSKSGYVLATFGELVESGNLGPVDAKEAVEYYRRSAELGHPRGQSNLAYMYSKGRGVEQDWERSLHWYSKAAEQGQGRGIYGVGVAYDNGYQVAQNKSVANEYFLKAADKKYKPAVEIVEERDLRGVYKTNSLFKAIYTIYSFFGE